MYRAIRRHFCRRTCLCALSIIIGASASAATGNGYWDSRFNSISAKTTVDISSDDTGRLLVWGPTLPVSFPLPGTTTVARWDGLSWETLAKGGTPPAVIFASAGKVYAGGNFAAINGVSIPYIAVLDNGAWTPLGSGVNGAVASIAVFGTNVVAGGSFTQAGGTTVGSIALWNGSAWLPLGEGLTGTVAKVTSSSDTVYAAWAAGTQAEISTWNGSNWAVIGTFSSFAGTANVHALQWISDSLFVGGRFDSIDGQLITNIARFKDVAWSQWAGGRVLGQPESFAVSGEKLYVSGNLSTVENATTNQFALAQVDASNVFPELQGEAKIGRSMTIVGSEIFVVSQPFLPSLSGIDQNFFSDSFGLIWHHNGSSWGLVSNIPQFQPAFQQIADSSDGLVGTITAQLGVFINPLLWNGNRFQLTEVEQRTDGGRIDMKFGLVQLGRSAYAQGTLTVPGQPQRDIILSLTNGVWSPTTLPINGQISAIGFHKDKIVVAVRTVDTVEHWNVWIWDGNTWVALGGGFDGAINCFATFKSDLYVGGTMFNSDGVSVNCISRFDGNGWTPVGSGVGGTFVITLAPTNEKLYVGGVFVQAGGIDTTNLATWNGSQWEPFYGLTNGSVKSISISSDGLIAVAGSYRYVDGLDAGGIAIWNGSAWATLGANTSQKAGPNIMKLVWRGHDLFVAGLIGGWDGVISQHFGLWHQTGVVLETNDSISPLLRITATGAVPNQFGLESTVDFKTWIKIGMNSLGNDRPWVVDKSRDTAFIRANVGN
jgi:hypothetical protein